MVLLSSEAASMSTAAAIISKGTKWEAEKVGVEKLRLRLDEEMRTINANSKV